MTARQPTPGVYGEGQEGAPVEPKVERSVADIPDEELLRRAVTSARSNRSRGYQPRWFAVMDAFLLGSTYAHQLCVRFGLDPDERVRR